MRREGCIVFLKRKYVMFCILSQPLAVAKRMLPFSRTLKNIIAHVVQPLLKHFNKFSWAKDPVLFKIFISLKNWKQNVP